MSPNPLVNITNGFFMDMSVKNIHVSLMDSLTESPTRFILVILLVCILKQLTTPCSSPIKMVIIYQQKFH
jgi:hypothetical protein